MRAAFDSRYSDFDLMAWSGIDWDQRYDHIGRGRFEGRLAQVVLNTLQVARERWNPGIMQRGSGPAHCWVIALPIAAEGSLHLRGRQILAGEPLLVGPCDDIAFTANGRTDLVMVVLPVGEIARWMQICRGTEAIDKKYLNRPWKVSEREVARRGMALCRLLRSLLDSAHGDAEPGALAAIESRIVEVVLGMVPSTDVAEPLHRRGRVAMKLRDMLTGNVETPLSISAMCETLDVRERTLFLACVEAFGRPPKALLLELRLNAVRRALLHPSAERSVTTVASRFGFWHFGTSPPRKRQFGELPSVTLAKAGGAAQTVTGTQSCVH